MDKLDVKLWKLAARGQIVPKRSLLKTPRQIEAIKKSAALNTAVLDHVASHIHEGMCTEEIDRLVYDFTTEHGGIPAPLNYDGFPKSVCTSLNNVICHGIPSEYEILQERRRIHHLERLLFRRVPDVHHRRHLPGSREACPCDPGMRRPWIKSGKALGAFGRHCLCNQQPCQKAWLLRS